MANYNNPSRLFEFAAKSVNEGLVAAWNLSSTADSFGSNTLTNNNAATFVAGKIGNAVSLNGTTQFLSVADNAALSFGAGQKFSACGWFNVNSVSSRRTIFSKYTSAGDQREYLLFVETTGQLRFIVTANGITDVIVESPASSILLNVWYFFAVWYDGTNIYLEINNSGTIYSTPHTTDIFNGTSSFIIGKFDATAFFSGLIDSVRIYKHANRVLTNLERSVLYNLGVGTEFVSNSFVNANEFNRELNQLIAIFGGTTQDVTPKVAVDSVVPTLAINQLGSGPILQCLNNNVLKAEVLNNGQFKSYLATGTTPITIAGATTGLINNLNVDLLDDIEASAILKTTSKLIYNDAVIIEPVSVGVQRFLQLSGDVIIGIYIKARVQVSIDSLVGISFTDVQSGGIAGTTYPSTTAVLFLPINNVSVNEEHLYSFIINGIAGFAPVDLTLGVITEKLYTT